MGAGLNGSLMIGLGEVVGGDVLCRHGVTLGCRRGKIVKHIFRLIAQFRGTIYCYDFSPAPLLQVTQVKL